MAMANRTKSRHCRAKNPPGTCSELFPEMSIIVSKLITPFSTKVSQRFQLPSCVEDADNFQILDLEFSLHHEHGIIMEFCIPIRNCTDLIKAVTFHNGNLKSSSRSRDTYHWIMSQTSQETSHVTEKSHDIGKIPMIFDSKLADLRIAWSVWLVSSLVFYWLRTSRTFVRSDQKLQLWFKKGQLW